MDAAAFERMQEERNRLARTVDKLCGKLEAADQECDVVVRLSKEREEQARSAQGSLTL